jgi:hypothetical protein
MKKKKIQQAKSLTPTGAGEAWGPDRCTLGPAQCPGGYGSPTLG